MAIETHSSFLLSCGKLYSFFLPSNVIVNNCSRSLITRFSASPTNLHKIPCIFCLRVSAFSFHELLLHQLMNPVSFSYLSLNFVINFLVNDTNYCVDCMCHAGVKGVVLGAELITISFLQLFSLLCLKVQQKLHPYYSESRFFILFVSAFFLKTDTRKRSILSREAIG